MSDDIDLDDVERTLNEAEAKYGEKAKKPTLKAATGNVEPEPLRASTSDRMLAAHGKQSSSNLLSDDDLSFLRMVEEECSQMDVPKAAAKNTSVSEPTLNVFSAGKGQSKCSPVFLGGSAEPLGFNSRSPVRCCDNLLCIKCDFKVISFNNNAWHEDCDYLFFRNYMPVAVDLKQKLQFLKGSRAYCCQCQWASVSERIEVRTASNANWVCRKH